MKLLRNIFGPVFGLAVGLFFAKSSGKELRHKLEGKSSADKAKVLGDELLGVGKEMLETIEGLSDKDQIKALFDMGKNKLQSIVKAIKASNNSSLSKYLPKIEKALKMFDKTIKKDVVVAKKAVSKAAKTVKKAITPKTKTTKKEPESNNKVEK